MERSKKPEQIVPQVDMSHFLSEAMERSARTGINEATAEYLEIADAMSLQTFMMRRYGSARDCLNDAKRAFEMAVNDMAEARMAEWLLARRNTLLAGKKASK